MGFKPMLTALDFIESRGWTYSQCFWFLSAISSILGCLLSLIAVTAVLFVVSTRVSFFNGVRVIVMGSAFVDLN